MTTHQNNGSQANYSHMILPKYKELVTSSFRLKRRATKTRARSKVLNDAKQ